MRPWEETVTWCTSSILSRWENSERWKGRRIEGIISLIPRSEPEAGSDLSSRPELTTKKVPLSKERNFTSVAWSMCSRQWFSRRSPGDHAWEREWRPGCQSRPISSMLWGVCSEEHGEGAVLTGPCVQVQRDRLGHESKCVDMKGTAEKTLEKGGDVDYSGRQCETVLNPPVVCPWVPKRPSN